MKLKYIFSAAILMLSAVSQAQQLNPITQAMFDGYAKLLQADPNDYRTLFERASQYYLLSNYDAALYDVKKSITNTPAKEKAQLVSEYALCADIYTELKQYPEALESINNALKLDIDSYPLLYTKGNICLHLNDLDQAYKCFKSMQRTNTRSTEALFGLAQVAIRQCKNNEAKELMQEIEKLSSNNALTYCRLGDLSREMKDPKTAANNYLNAFSLSSGSNTSRPMSSLMELAKSDYDALQQAIDYALNRTNNVLPLYFISGNAAITAGKYGDAYTTFRQILAQPGMEEDFLLTTLGDICLKRGDVNEADTYLTQALMKNDNLNNNILKAKIENARGNYASALIYAENALRKDDTDIEALMQVAEASLNKGDDAAAITALNNAIVCHPDDFRPFLVRGYIQSQSKSGTPAPASDFSRASLIPATTDEELTYKAIAQFSAGNPLDAEETIKPVKDKSNTDAEAAYLYALYLTDSGEAAHATEMIAQAIALGFENDYLLKLFSLPLISLKNTK